MGRRSSSSSLWVGSSCVDRCGAFFFQGRIEDFDFALGAEVAKPVVKEDVDFLLKEDLLNARGDFFDGWNVFASGVVGTPRVGVVGGDFLIGDADALAERSSMKLRI